MPRQGYRVAPVSLSEVLDMFHLRAALERACVERIVLYASDEQLKELNAFRHFDAATWDGGFIAYNRAFHQRLAELHIVGAGKRVSNAISRSLIAA